MKSDNLVSSGLGPWINFWSEAHIVKKIFITSSIIFCLSQVSAIAQQQQFSFYGGIQESPHSTVKHGGVDIGAGWKGKSLSSPQYYGFRYTRWLDEQNGWSVNFTHSKAYSDDFTRQKYNYKVLEFTDGVNPITLNYVRRYDLYKGWTPYAAAGIGFAIPHVEVQKKDSDLKTSEYQFSRAPAFRLSLGGSKKINESWSWFMEYDFHYVMLNVKHDTSVKTNLIHNAFNLGVNYSFWILIFLISGEFSSRLKYKLEDFGIGQLIPAQEFSWHQNTCAAFH